MAQKLMSANSTDKNFKMYKSKKSWVFAYSTTLALAAVAGITLSTTNVHADTTNGGDNQVNATAVTQNTTSNTVDQIAANTAQTDNTSTSINIRSLMDDLASGDDTSSSQNGQEQSQNYASSNQNSQTQQENGNTGQSTAPQNGTTSDQTNSDQSDKNYYVISTRDLDKNGNVNYLTQKNYTSIKGQEVADGTVVTWPLSVSALPANRAQDLKSHVISETLDPHLEYLHYRAYLTNTDGTVTDVTNHVNLNRSGQTLIFTDDNYLLSIYNNNRYRVQNLPVIKLVTKANGNGYIIPNAFKSSYVFNDGSHDVSFTTTSNNVQIKTFNPGNSKDVEIGGNVQGDPSGTINGQVVADGSVVTWPMSVGDLPANRAQDVLSHIETDTLSNGLNYEGFHAYLPQADGSFQDVSDHINVQQNGQDLTFVVDDYLIGLYNQDKSTSFKMPIIDLITSVHGTSIIAPNKFNSQLTFKDGNGQTVINNTSNQVQISTYHPTNTKDVELGGNVQGDTPNSINDKVVANGAIVTWPMASSELPANRVQDLQSRVISETLDSHLQYQGYKAWLQNADGKYTDVTSHVKLTQDGQNLTFADDEYLLNLYNSNKGTAYKLPIIDLVTKVNGAGITAPNSYTTKYVYSDGDGNTTINVTSNTVKISTFNPTTNKDVELGDNIHGDTESSIAGKLISEGTIVTWPLSTSDLPANRAQDVVSHTAVDALEPTLQYISYTAWLPDANGQLQDVTSHVKMTRDGQKLTFTDDDYLIGLYNQNKNIALKMPIIDLVTKAAGNTKLLPNSFDSQFVYNDVDGNTIINVSSNKPTVETFDPTVHKDVELGGNNVQGDTPNSIDGKIVAQGTVVTWPMSTSDLPANRTQDVVSHSTSETLNQNLQYVGYHAYMPDANGKLQDVTSHVQLQQNGQNLVFTDDSYLISLYNQDKSIAFKMPIIDLMTKAISDSATIPNTFESQYVFNDGNGNTTFKSTSNTVQIVTYKPKTTKDAELGDNIHGDTNASIAGQMITDGTIVTWPMSTSDLPANRTQDLQQHVITDNLNENLIFQGYTAWLPTANGLIDVTNHIGLTRDGQNLTFTDDDYLLNLYNQNKDTAYKFPIIDLVTKANGNTKLIPNNFDSMFIYNDGDQQTTVNVTSNTINISTYDPTATKDVELGDDIEGETADTINNLMVQIGTKMTYPLTVSDLPANRADEITAHQSVDTLSDNLEYQSYKAYLPDTNGKLQDVTDHVKLTRDEQKLSFNDDDYLINMYNNSKATKQAMPIIDLVAKVTGNNDGKKVHVIPNHFDSTITTKNGKINTTSNTVVINSVDPEAIKDVELGDNVVGDTPNSVTGTVVADGTIVTWPMSVGSLGANRAQNVIKHTETENLDSSLTYLSFKAYLPDADGKMQDITEHINVQQDGQKLVFTDDDYLISLYNKDKSQRFALPVIDLVTRVNGDNKVIPNTFVSQFTFNDGKGNTITSVTSNQVNVSTFKSNPEKHVALGTDIEGDDAENADGTVVAQGSEVTWPLSDKSPLPANRSQDVKSHTLVDKLDDNLQYNCYKAYLKGADGKLQDVTDHVKLTRDGQTLTFTDDDYLLNLYNKDKATAFNLPIIDLVTTVVGNGKLIPNKFDSNFVFSDGNKDISMKTTSNEVNISTYTPVTNKDAELGDNVVGDTSDSIANETVPDGTVVTWPLSVSSLPANRSQDVFKHVIEDILDDNLTYNSFKAYLKDAAGNLQDVTDHVKLAQEGQHLTFTDDDYLINLYNSSKNKEQSLPIIDLVTTVHGDSKLIPNEFDNVFVFKDGKGQTTVKTTSNKVTIKTASLPTPTKEETDDQGNNINGNEVKAGEHVNYTLNWDLSNNKDVKATPEMIKKGFFFIDPIDSRALSVDDLSKAKVVDQNGNKVDGISFHLYNSLSEAPEFIQEQVKANNLQDKITGPFVVAQADDPQAFFDKYVKTGAKLKVTIPTIVKSGFTGEFSNTAYQFGFGKATQTNTVTNYVKPIPKPASPETPAAIAPQVISATAQPMTSDAPVTPNEKTAKLPQTGNADEDALLGLAAASLVGSLGLAALGLKQNRNND